MKISFWNIDEFAQEIKERNCQSIYRDFVAESEMVETSNKELGRIPIERMKIILTATDGKDILHTKFTIFSSPIISETERKKIEELMKKWDKEVLPKIFIGISIKKGVIESL